ncbi:MAG: hypothetical protein RJA22_608 [Verrucomicrobiota bacterium]
MHLPLLSSCLGLLLLVPAGFLDAAAPEAGRTARGPRTALDRYVAAPDTNYAFRLVQSTRVEGMTIHYLDLTSQAWLTTNEVNQPLWRHWLTIVVPDQLRSTTALLFINGGSTRTNPPSKPDTSLLLGAAATGTVVADLRNVPAQPLIFAGETKPRSEDSLIAYTWDKFLRTGDERWPARLPMTKAAVRAMDTVSTFSATNGSRTRVEKFFVAGGSKRGWTTWTAAAVDERVVGIAPIVIDLLNIVPSFEHHWKAYGFWAPAVRDYVNMRIMDWSGSREYDALMRIEEPYEYRQRLTLPKFIINASGDQFFLPDSSRFYFEDLPGVKYLRYVPNTDHSLRGSDAWTTLLACYGAVVQGAPLPKFSWRHEGEGVLRVQNSDKPTEVKLWQATNPTARDFRLMTIQDAWKSTPLKDEGGGRYLARVPRPAEGWTAYFVELTFAGVGAAPFKFTTGVHVTPETLPHPYTKPTPPR